MAAVAAAKIKAKLVAQGKLKVEPEGLAQVRAVACPPLRLSARRQGVKSIKFKFGAHLMAIEKGYLSVMILFVTCTLKVGQTYLPSGHGGMMVQPAGVYKLICYCSACMQPRDRWIKGFAVNTAY